MKNDMTFEQVRAELDALARSRLPDVVVAVRALRLDGDGTLAWPSGRARLSAAARTGLATGLPAEPTLLPTDGDNVLAALVTSRLARARSHVRLRLVRDDAETVIRAVVRPTDEPEDERSLVELLAALGESMALAFVGVERGQERTIAVGCTGATTFRGGTYRHGLVAVLDECGIQTLYAALVLPHGGRALTWLASERATREPRARGSLVAQLRAAHGAAEQALVEAASEELRRPRAAAEVFLDQVDLTPPMSANILRWLAERDAPNRLDLVELIAAPIEGLDPDVRLALEARAGDLLAVDV